VTDRQTDGQTEFLYQYRASVWHNEWTINIFFLVTLFANAWPSVQHCMEHTLLSRHFWSTPYTPDVYTCNDMATLCEYCWVRSLICLHFVMLIVSTKMGVGLIFTLFLFQFGMQHTLYYCHNINSYLYWNIINLMLNMIICNLYDCHVWK